MIYEDFIENNKYQLPWEYLKENNNYISI
jgi:hypothetical protein